MKKKVVNALLLGMAITLSTPVIGYAAKPEEATESSDESNDMEQSDNTAAGITENETEQEEATVEDEHNSPSTEAEDEIKNTSTTQLRSYTDYLTDVSEILKGKEFIADKDTFISEFEQFCNEHSMDYGNLSDFLDAYLKTVKNTEDRVTVLKAFGSACKEEMDEYTKSFIRSVIEDSAAGDEEKEVYLSILELSESQEEIWSYYGEWVETYPESKDPDDVFAGSDNSDENVKNDNTRAEENNGENTGNNNKEEKRTPPANAAEAVDQLRGLDYSTLVEELQSEAQKLIEDAIAKIDTCNTEEEVSTVVEDTKAKLKELEDKNLQSIRIEVALNELKQLKDSLTFANDSDKLDAEEAYNTYVEMLKQATTEKELSQIVNTAKKSLQDIADGTGDVLTSSQKKAISELVSLRDEISDKETAFRTFALWSGKIESCTTKVEVETYLVGGKESLTKLKEAVLTEELQSYVSFVDSLKLLCTGQEDSELQEYIKDSLKKENQTIMTADFLTALENAATDSFKKELLKELDAIISTVPDDLVEQTAKIKSDASDAMARVSNKKEAYLVYRESTEKVKKLDISREELTKKIEENLKALDSLTTLDSDEAKEIIKIYREKISEAKTVEEADSLLNGAKEKLKKLEKDDEEARKLTAAKETAYKQLDALLQGVTDNSLKLDLQDCISSYKSKIAIADTVDEVTNFVKDAVEDLKNIKKKYETETALKTAKEKAITQIESFVNNVKDADLKAQLKKLADSVKADVNNAMDTQTISSIVSRFKDDATALTKEYAENKALSAKRTSTVKKITDFTKGKNMTNEMYNLYIKAKEDVMNAQTSSEIDNIYNTFAKEFNEMQMASLRSEYDKKLSDILNSVDSSSSKYSEIYSVISKARENIARASSKDLMDKIYTQAKTNVETLSRQNDTQDSLETIKEKAINDLRSATTLTSSTAQKVISVYSNKIQNATSESEVQQALSEGLALLQKLNDSARQDGTGDGTNVNGTQVNGSTMNKADGSPNSNTTYTSTAKADTTGLKGNVKTGDENGIKIVLSVAGLITALGAFGYLLWRKIKK